MTQAKHQGIDLSTRFNSDLRKDFHVQSYFEREDRALRKQTALNSLTNRSDLGVEGILESLRHGGEDFLDEAHAAEFASSRGGSFDSFAMASMHHVKMDPTADATSFQHRPSAEPKVKDNTHVHFKATVRVKYFR